MCGIWAYIELIKNKINHQELFNDFMNLKHRGPDVSSYQIIKNTTIGFHRLSIMEPGFHANQPYVLHDINRTIVFICNGEIYNFNDLIYHYKLPIYDNSDCLVIPHLYLKTIHYNHTGNNIDSFVNLFKYKIKGEFAFMLFEFDKFQNIKEVVIGRDCIGVRPLYIGNNNNGIILSSEIKGMTSFPSTVNEFKPGTIKQIVFNNSETKNDIYNIFDYDFKTIYDIIPYEYIDMNDEQLEECYLYNIRNALTRAVSIRLTADCPIGFLLSGGLDSSLISSIAASILETPINTFCCGLIGTDSTDIKYARLAADYIKSNHTEILVTIDEALSLIDTVIKTIESWCITTVRASIPQYIVSNYIGKNTNIKVIITGETADEVASGYLYNYYAPSATALDIGAKEYVHNIHMYDGRRCDRCVSAASCEARIPFADPSFIDTYWHAPAEMRMPTYNNCEKWLLRKSFEGRDIIHPKVLWRRKEAFSDGISGVAKSWFQILQEHIETLVSNDEFNSNNLNCKTKEEYYYKKIFIKYYGIERIDIIPNHWQPKWDLNGCEMDYYVDPSARTLQIY